MYVNAPGYHSVHPGKFDLFQRFSLTDMSSGVKATAGFAVS
jgi:hypothetical protein